MHHTLSFLLNVKKDHKDYEASEANNYFGDYAYEEGIASIMILLEFNRSAEPANMDSEGFQCFLQFGELISVLEHLSHCGPSFFSFM